MPFTLSEPMIALASQITAMSCDEQHYIATRVAANIGYQLVPEASIQDAEDNADVLRRLDRLEAAVLELNPALNWP